MAIEAVVVVAASGGFAGEQEREGEGSRRMHMNY